MVLTRLDRQRVKEESAEERQWEDAGKWSLQDLVS